MGYRLGVDLGTTFTAAAVDDGTGPTMLGLGNRALTVPSVVYLGSDGAFLFGEAADRRAATDPSRSAREFKRRIGDTVPILLGGQPFSPQALSAKLLAWTISVAAERQGAAPEGVVVTYPANWGGYKRDLLQQVVSLADVPTAVTCTEPEAAATQYASRASLAAGDKVAVYDLGGGTFDVCVLEKHDHGFTIIGAPDGVEHLGGIDFDEAVFQHVLGMLTEQGADLDPTDPQVTDGLARLRRECVDAKEALSNDVETTLSVILPGLTTSVRLTRAELDGLITSPLRDTLDAMERALRSAHLTAADLTTVVLVGGSSRIPLVSHLLQSEFGVRTALDTHPKHDIALGAVQYRPTEETLPAPAAAPTVTRWPTRGKKTTDPAPPPDPAPAAAGAPAAPEQEPVTQPLPTVTEDEAPQPAGPPTWTPPVAGAKPPAEPTEASWRTRLAGRRTLLIVLGAAAAVAILAGSVFALTRGGGDSRVVSEDSILVPIVKSGTTDPVLHRISSENGEDLGKVPGLRPGSQSLASQSRDGRHIIYRWGPPGSGWRQGVTRLEVTDGHESQPLFASPPQQLDCYLRVGWSPNDKEIVLPCDDQDGHRIVYTAELDADGQVDPDHLRPQFGDEQSSGSSVGSVGFADDGRIVANLHGGSDRGVYVTQTGGDPKRLTGHDDVDTAPSPTGDLVAFVRDGDLYLVSLDRSNPPCPPSGSRSKDDVTGTPLCDLTPSARNVEDPSWSWDGTWIAYRTEDPGTERSILHLISPDGQSPPQLSPTPFDGALSWGPR